MCTYVAQPGRSRRARCGGPTRAHRGFTACAYGGGGFHGIILKGARGWKDEAYAELREALWDLDGEEVMGGVSLWLVECYQGYKVFFS